MTVVQQGGSTVGTYVYNANNERVAKTASKVTTRFVYDEASQLVSEASGTTRREYVAIGGLPVAVVDGGTVPTIGFVTADGLGSPRAVTSTAGAVIWNWPYSLNPLGENRALSASGYVLNLRLPGQYADGEAGLKYNIHRSFDAASGRYLQSDPIGLDGGINTYGYAKGNPLNAFDRNGLKVEFANPNAPGMQLIKKAYNNVKATARGGQICNALETSTETYTIDTAENGPLYNDPDPRLRSQPSYVDYNNNRAWFDPTARPLENTSDGLQPASLEDQISHELGHLATGIRDSGPDKMDNINMNENPVRIERREPKRVTYDVLP